MLHAIRKSYLTLRLHWEKNKKVWTATQKLMCKIRQLPTIPTSWTLLEQQDQEPFYKMAIQLAYVMDSMKCWL